MGACGVTFSSMLIWTTSLTALQILEFFYGLYLASEVAYHTYIYAKVDRAYYPKVTAHARAAMFLGKFVAGGSSQILINFEIMTYKSLNYITWSSKYANDQNSENALTFHSDEKRCFTSKVLEIQENTCENFGIEKSASGCIHQLILHICS